MFSKVEIAVLGDFAIERGIPHPAAGVTVLPLDGTIMLIAWLDDYLTRKK